MPCRRNPKRDHNEQAIIRTCRILGASVVQLNETGVPDLCVGFETLNGQKRNVLVEVKSKTGSLTPPQLSFFETWCGACYVVRSPQEMVKILVESGLLCTHTILASG